MVPTVRGVYLLHVLLQLDETLPCNIRYVVLHSVSVSRYSWPKQSKSALANHTDLLMMKWALRYATGRYSVTYPQSVPQNPSLSSQFPVTSAVSVTPPPLHPCCQTASQDHNQHTSSKSGFSTYVSEDVNSVLVKNIIFHQF